MFEKLWIKNKKKITKKKVEEEEEEEEKEEEKEETEEEVLRYLLCCFLRNIFRSFFSFSSDVAVCVGHVLFTNHLHLL